MKVFIFGTLLTVILTLASGIVQGKLSNRWGSSDLLKQAGAKLESFPQKFAAWEMKKETKLTNDALVQLQPSGYFQRDYVNSKTGAAVNVLILLGQSGPISVHTPEVCYVSRDHLQIGERQEMAVPGPDNGNTIWKTTFRLKGVDAQMQNIYYGWSLGDRWVAADNPRFTYATRPYLYKIQLTSILPAEKMKTNDPAADPALRFMADFIPVSHKYLQKPSTQ